MPAYRLISLTGKELVQARNIAQAAMPTRSRRWIKGRMYSVGYPDCTYLFVLHTIDTEARMAICKNIYYKDTRFYV
jgi:hypothetical protein